MEDLEIIKELPKPMKISSLYFNGKYKLMASIYNLVHSYPADMAEFSPSTIYLLGKTYNEEPRTPNFQTEEDMSFTLIGVSSASPQPPLPIDKSILFSKQYFRDFLLSFRSILWFCYRKEFPPLEPFNITTDIGWGCMMRTGQMMLANALKRHLLGDNWKLNDNDIRHSHTLYRQIIRWFLDLPQSRCPYSIHNLVYRSKVMDHFNGEDINSNNKIGEWYSPTKLCQILRHIVNKHRPKGIVMYIPKEGVIALDRISQLCSNGSLNSINKEYVPFLKALLRLPQTIGLIGGRPKQSLYFVGYQDDNVIYLDPHIVRPSVKTEQEYSIENFHRDNPHMMPFINLDPSFAIGFYCRTEADFDSLCNEIKELGKIHDPIISIADNDPCYSDNEEEDEKEAKEDKEIIVF